MASYNTGFAQHTLTDSTDSLVAGSTYRLRYRAENTDGGLGTASDTVTVALVDKPAAPASLSKTMAYSSKTSLRIEWDAVTVPAGQTPGGAITGYVLLATDPLNGTSWEAFNGVELGLTDQTSATVLGLTMGRVYQFQAIAYNFNGAGTASSVHEFYSCVLPSGFSAPYRTGSSASTIDIAWAPPQDPGGCVITGFAVFKDDGAGTGTFAEANSANDLAIRDQPGLNSATITTFAGSDVGLDFVFYLEVYTEAGDTA